jgi:hypothetical protein
LPPTWPIRSGRFTWPSWSHRLALITSDGPLMGSLVDTDYV